MPNAASVTVKNSANVDKVFDVENPASGNTPAVYSMTSASTKQAHRPRIDVLNREVNGSSTDRKGLITGYFPVVETINGVPQVTKFSFFKLETKTNMETDDAVLTDQATLFLNFCGNSAIIKSAANGLNQT